MGRFAHSQHSQRQKYDYENRYRNPYKRSRHGERVPLKDAIKRQPRNPAPKDKSKCAYCQSSDHRVSECPKVGACKRGVNGEIIARGSCPRCFCCGNRNHKIRIKNRGEVTEFSHTSENCPFRHPDSHRRAYGYCPACERKLERCWNCAKITCPAQKRRSRHCYGHLLNKCKNERNNKDVINETDPVHNFKRPREERVPTGIKRGIRQLHTHQHHQYAKTVQKLLGCHDENKKWQFERELLIVLKQMKKLKMDSDDDVLINADELLLKEEIFNSLGRLRLQHGMDISRHLGHFDAAIDGQKQPASKEA